MKTSIKNLLHYLCAVRGLPVGIAALGLILAGAAKGQSSGDYNGFEWYSGDGETAEITGYDGLGGNVAIPSIINHSGTNYSVISIGTGAFAFLTNLTSVIIPNSVTNIGVQAFRGCSVTSVTIPNSVTNIGSAAFNFCLSLTNVTIPDSVTSIGNIVFAFCTNLTSVTIPNSVTSIGDSAFGACFSLTSVIIPNSVTNIGYGAFSNSGSLASITLPNSVTNIEDFTFRGCYGLTSVTIPKSVTSIAQFAFNNCGLTYVTIPDGVTNIGDGAFSDCSSLIGVYFNGNAPAADSTVFNGDNATVCYLPGATGWGNTFAGLPAKVEFSVATNAGAIGLISFLGPGGTVIIPDTISGLPVTSIGNAFSGCTSLTSVTIPDTVTSIGSNAFSSCRSLTSVTIPDTVTSILGGGFFGGVFYQCTSLPDVTIPDSVTSLGSDSLYECTSLTSIYFQGNPPSLGSSVFFGDINTIAYYLPGTTGWGATFGGIPTALFDFIFTTNNRAITITGFISAVPGVPMVIPRTINSLPVTTIGNSAFSGWTGLPGVTIPNVVTNIGDDAFAGCTGLINAGITNGLIGIGVAAFSNCASLTSITIPKSVTSIGSGAFQSCVDLTGVTIGNGVTNVGNDTFQDCANLTAAYFLGNAPSIGSDVFSGDNNATIYYVSGTTGWGSSFAGLPVVSTTASAQFTYTTNAGAITITRYSGTNTVVGIPPLINGLPVTSIGSGSQPFFGNTRITSVTIPNSVTGIADFAFENCTSLTGIAIPNSITSIGGYAFYSCTNLTSVMIGDSVTSIGADAFQGCSNLTSIFFNGNAPNADSTVFANDNNATIYYLPGATGWSSPFAGIPAMLWTPQIQADGASFGVQNNQFGFNINWASGQTVVVEACADLANPVWIPLQTNTIVNGSFYFSEPLQTNGPGRYYRISSP